MFKPHLAPNQQIDLETIDYSRGYYASTKLDGVRLIIKSGKLFTRSLKPLPNKQLNDKFEPLRSYTENYLIMLDGEIYAEGVPFGLIISCCMTQDYTDKKAIRSWENLCNEYEVDYTRKDVLNLLKFYIFDCVELGAYSDRFSNRYACYTVIAKRNPDLITRVYQRIAFNADEVRTMFKNVLKCGYEGLMLKSFDCPYKFGRSTIKEGTVYKIKPYISVDERIVGITQATVVNPDAPRTVNELGRTVTSKLKENRILIPRAACFIVNYEGHKLEVAIGQTEAVRDDIWKNPSNFIGKIIEFKGLVIGSKDVPRHAIMVRFREELDKNG